MTETALQVNNGPSAMIALAVQQGTDLTQLERLLDLQIKWEANEAKKAYVEDMALFKNDPPDIYKDKVNKQFGSKYSSIDALVNPTIPQLSKYGLSHRWDYPKMDDPKLVGVTCILTHKLGHSESVTMYAPPDTSGGNSKNPIQQIKSTMTYLKIATFEAVTGLVSREANRDDDGNGSQEPEYITVDQQTEINDLVKESGANLTKFLEVMKADSVETILAINYKTAVSALNAKKAAKK